MDLSLVACACGAGTCAFVAAFVLLEGPLPERTEAASSLAALRDRVLQNALVKRLVADAERGARRSKLLRQLPTMLDIVTLGLSSGLSFDSSLELYCDRYATELSKSLAETMLSWRIGIRSRADALEGLADELQVLAFRRFADAVVQALTFGSPLAQALEGQAQAIRDEQRSELEAEMERAPVKMLVPLGTLIVPAMLLSILGPLVGSSIGIAG